MSLTATLLVAALLAQVVLALAMYVVLFRARAATVRAGERTIDDFLLPRDEPGRTGFAARALANQFELPVLFYVLALTILAAGTPTLIDVLLAWVFVVSRIAHAVAHASGRPVRVRGTLFGIGYAIVCLLALRVFLLLIAGG